ncbi:ankyrin repeat-containing domain protein, partial [Mycena epipterygia]
LADLPGQLFEIYDRFLESIHPNNFVLVEVALRWLISSARPLSLAELEDALAFDFSDPHRHLFQPTQRDDCANRVCSLLEGLVTVGRLNYWNETPVVVLAHASVADYLKSPQFAARHKCDLSQGFSHTFLAQTCVGYLLHFADHPLNAETFPNYPLSSYAAKYWSYHLLRCHDRATLETSTMRLLEAGSGQYATLNHLHCHINIVRLLLEKGANFNAADGKHGSALQAASAGGHTEIVRLLLENGADVNAEGGVYGSALQGASEQGSLEIFRILLEEGADVNMAGGFYGSALQAASRQGSLEIVRILLKEGADVNAAGGRYGSALQAASYYGSLEIVRLLLESGADLNATGGIYGSALQAACEGGVREIVRLLLENGAHVNAEGGHCGTALRVASIFGQTEIVRLLLENGADVNASGGQDGSPLQDASEEGYTAIVQLLREHGAVGE